ncbi:TolC family protein [Chryseobacterium capnotolerans]|uniref:TolC family protein n=1 Tax=Chryseobacterium capnotolerans TaxID=2759528 RepID=UPI0024B52A56|nr:TolC family protein [Chryseobacterium capnotolerans]UHO37356.1 TolC family protein [Chryseobacterium capnotolerans]
MKRKFFFLIFSLITLEIFAQTPNYPTRWTLDNCIEYAKENNISINSLRLSKNSAQQDLLQAKEAKYPNLNGTISQGLFSLNGNDGLHLTGAQTQSMGANSSMTLYHANYIKNNESSKKSTGSDGRFICTGI